MPPSIGDTYLIPTPPDYKIKHLYILIAQDPSTGLFLAVNVTKKRPGTDFTCELNVGDHSFITNPSIIKYDEPIEVECTKLEDALNKSIIVSRQAVSPELLEKIQLGAKTSPAFAPRYLKYFD